MCEYAIWCRGLVFVSHSHSQIRLCTCFSCAPHTSCVHECVCAYKYLYTLFFLYICVYIWPRMKTHRSRARAHSLVQVSYYMSIGYYYIMYISESRVRCVSLFQTDFTYKHVFFPFTNAHTASNLPPLLPSTLHIHVYQRISAHIIWRRI